MRPLKAVLLLSGGLDSAANLCLGRDSHPPFEVSVALTIDYGQRSQARELEYAQKLARYFAVEHVSFSLQNFTELAQGAPENRLLNSKKELPTLDSLDEPEETRKSAQAVWVPNRNGVLISLASVLAESRRLDAVAMGFNIEEAATFTDNSAAFLKAQQNALSYSTANQVRLVSATLNLTKTEIVARLSDYQFPFELIWSCYLGGPTPCGVCESCQRLKRALD